MKYCPKCKTNKDYSEFYKNKKTKDGFRCYCKVCEKQGNKKREPEYKETRRRYRETDTYKKIKRNYYKNNKEKVLTSNKSWRRTKRGKYFSYKKSAKQRNIIWNLSETQFFEFWNKSCFYCGDDIETIGIDRIDSSGAYTLDNCISCCTTCNKMKLNLPKDKFIAQIYKIVENLKDENH